MRKKIYTYEKCKEIVSQYSSKKDLRNNQPSVYVTISKNKWKDLLEFYEEKEDNQIKNLFLGDACEVLEKIPENSIDLIVTSPPYDNLRKYNGNNSQWNHEKFKCIAKGLEDAPEGGERCHKCYNLRLEKTAILAKENGFDYFCTTLTVSPFKNSRILNEIGSNLEKLYDVKYLYSDFKKEDGYKKSIEYSKKYNLYRQNYCGCIYSKNNLK